MVRVSSSEMILAKECVVMSCYGLWRERFSLWHGTCRQVVCYVLSMEGPPYRRVLRAVYGGSALWACATCCLWRVRLIGVFYVLSMEGPPYRRVLRAVYGGSAL
ncbi:hypothetical protein RRG08_037493 [Elysia crispata]|uniref:Uncharacterized protein n=1 Tax=Elysia crispata TaxID=231223 RepID=A0AAE1AZY5_9GAST|nr:hypothetical protein RRG08_037493 [Elysia crispata]